MNRLGAETHQINPEDFEQRLENLGHIQNTTAWSKK
jgi:hypothetical protein